MESICKLKDIYKALYEFEASFLQQNQITINEGMILCLLGDGPQKAGVISVECSLSTSRLSKVLANLEGKGYIIRTFGANDRRQVMVELTEKGEAKRCAIKQQQVCIPEALSKLIE